jgi:hypothetical protein
MDFYLYPPKYISSSAIAALTPPHGRRPGEANSYRRSMPELSGEDPAFNCANATEQAPDVTPPLAAAVSPALDTV